MRIATVCVLLSAALLFPPATAMETSHAPLAVATFEIDATGAYTFVTWIPGADSAESFRVYGISQGIPYLLGEVDAYGESLDALGTVVPTGFATYAVSGVKGGIESPLVSAVNGDPDPYCVIIDPPTIGIHCNPLDRIVIKFYAELQSPVFI